MDFLQIPVVPIRRGSQVEITPEELARIQTVKTKVSIITGCKIITGELHAEYCNYFVELFFWLA